MGKFFRKYRQYIVATLLLTFLLYIGNIYLFTHYHTIDGVKIAHSHIYSGTKDAPNHSHSTQQFNIIHQLSTFNSEEFCLSSVISTYIPFVDIFYQRECSYISHFSTLYHSLRAPPVMA